MKLKATMGVAAVALAKKVETIFGNGYVEYWMKSRLWEEVPECVLCDQFLICVNEELLNELVTLESTEISFLKLKDKCKSIIDSTLDSLIARGKTELKINGEILDLLRQNKSNIIQYVDSPEFDAIISEYEKFTGIANLTPNHIQNIIDGIYPLEDIIDSADFQCTGNYTFMYTLCMFGFDITFAFSLDDYLGNYSPGDTIESFGRKLAKGNAITYLKCIKKFMQARELAEKSD